jgi:tRNA(adenine34) deaminase
MHHSDDEKYIHHALKLAMKAQQQGEVPVGAVVVHNNIVIGEGFNQSITHTDPTAHAEVMALRSAATQLNNYRLVGATLYVTLEPCLMCLGAIFHARVSRLVFGAYDPRAGAVSSAMSHEDLNAMRHKIICDGGVLQQPCSEILQAFFKSKRGAT